MGIVGFICYVQNAQLTFTFAQHSNDPLIHQVFRSLILPRCEIWVISCQRTLQDALHSRVAVANLTHGSGIGQRRSHTREDERATVSLCMYVCV